MAMDAAREWPDILRFEKGATITEHLVEQHYRKLAKRYHPDAGGSDEDMKQLNLAKQLALKWIAKERERLERAEREARQAPDLAALQQSMLNQWAAQQSQQFAAQQQWMNNQWANSYSNLAANAYQSTRQDDPPTSSVPKVSRWKRVLRIVLGGAK